MKKQRILKVNLFDIPHDSEAAGRVVDKACSRRVPMRVKGCHFSGDKLLLVLGETNRARGVRHVFAQFPKENEDEIIAEINARRFAGFSFLAGFKVADTSWALFETMDDDSGPSGKK